ncbi:MAG: hypothetical protein NC308_02630 [Clostridium sp.]|nr:hypothetical protein [Bacteroides sp.]MCM1197760.1 hypothetical protein [Clostridium sp.]
MKRRHRLLAAMAAAILAISACEKEGTPRFRGNYTFKTGGTLTVRSTDAVASENSTISIVSENGQMDIVTTDKSTGEMIVTMNIVGGPAVRFNARADGKTLTLSPVRRQVSLSPANTSSEILRPLADVAVGGTGERYDNLVIFRLDYEGSYTYAGKEYEIVASSVDCIAKQN